MEKWKSTVAPRSELASARAWVIVCCLILTYIVLHLPTRRQPNSLLTFNNFLTNSTSSASSQEGFEWASVGQKLSRLGTYRSAFESVCVRAYVREH